MQISKNWLRTNKNGIAAVAVFTVLLVGSIGFTAWYGNLMYATGYQNAVYLYESMSRKEGLEGRLYATVIRESGAKEYISCEHNTITKLGLNATRFSIGKGGMDAFDDIGLGTGTGGDNSSTDLVTPFGSRQDGAFDIITAPYNWTVNYLFPAGTFDGDTITEAGVFNATSGGTMLNYQDGFSKTLASGDSLNVTFEFEIADAQWVGAMMWQGYKASTLIDGTPAGVHDDWFVVKCKTV